MSKLRKLKLSSVFQDGVMFLSGMLVTLILVWFNPFIMNPGSNQSTPVAFSTSTDTSPSQKTVTPKLNLTTFYDDPAFGYTMDKKIKNWDEKRKHWLATHPAFSGSKERIMMVTGTQPTPCKKPDGDHLLLRLFKNKVDYCRIHGHDIFYNNVLLHQGMHGFWAKYPLVKAAMLAHPEAEWIWWVDSDAIFTDMDFDLPVEKYKAYNLVAYGWPDLIFEKKSAMGVNAGVFLIRNCQWSIDMLERWASFGPQTKDYAKWGKVQQSMFYDKTDSNSDDQTALTYMLLVEKERWGGKIHIEGDYYFQGYWLDIVDKYDNVTRRYNELESQVAELRMKYAEKAGEKYRALWQKYLDEANTGGFTGSQSWRRPFMTHFTGCEPCSGDHNLMYTAEACDKGMVRALNFADNQVLRNFGYTRRDISNTPVVEPL
ncbi:putative glycosyltransferase 7 [Silene latifolia]|uniref:putative glycosyltransferase 7 n=1 Tax=Silene latifolia TaxID=37657 RepID=UPI003D7757F1